MTQPSNPGVPDGQSAPQASPSQTPQRASAPGQPVQQAPAAQSAPTPITRDRKPAAQGPTPAAPQTQGPAPQGQTPAAPQAQRPTAQGPTPAAPQAQKPTAQGPAPQAQRPPAQERPGTGAAPAQSTHLPPRTSTTRAYAPPAQAGPAQQGPGPQAAPDPGPRAGQGAQPQTGPQARRKPSVGKLIADITSQFSSIVRGEIELAKVQTATMFARIRTGLVLMAAAAVFALFLLGWILHTIEWAASLIIVGLLAVVVAVLALLGSRALRKAQESKPDPKAGITEAVHIVKNGLTK